MSGSKGAAWVVFGLLWGISACSGGGQPGASEQPEVRLALPTEGGFDPRSEEQDQQRREAWIEEMHGGDPRVDWRSIETHNRERALRRRNQRSVARAQQDRALPLPDGGDAPSWLPSAWEEIGSRNQAGHVRCAAIGYAFDGPRRLYVGSAQGGVWRGKLDGTDWEPLSDNLWGGVDEVEILPPDAPGRPEVIVIRRGTQVYTSRDDGDTWIPAAGLGAQRSVRRMAVLDDGQHTILLMGNRNTTAGEKTGIVASVDGGLSFEERWLSVTTSVSDMWVPAVGNEAGSTVYTVHRGRIRRSVDGGHTFTLQSAVDTDAVEGYIAGSEAGAPTLYVTLRVGGQWDLYRSDDAGLTTQRVQDDLGDYWGALSSFPSNPMAVVYGGVEAHRSLDGGLTDQVINTWGSYYGDRTNRLHADIRGIDAISDPDGSTEDYAYIATDGGLYVTRDSGINVLNVTLRGLGVGQFYSTHTSALDPDRIVGGTQDQGYQRGIRRLPSGPGPSTPMNQLISGDYGHLTSGDGTHSLVFSTYPGFILVQEGETGPVLRFEDFPNGSSSLWLPPVVADPEDPTAFFFLGSELFRYSRVNVNNWTATSHTDQNFLNPGSYLSALAFAPTDSQRAYAVTNVGRLWSSVDHGVTWTESADDAGSSHFFYGSALAVHPTNPLEAVVGGSGYSEPGVRRTLDGGATWQSIAEGLPPTLTHDLTYAFDGSGDIYAATEAGAYRWRRDLEVWVDIMRNDAPATIYWSVEAVPDLARIRFGTYGRGIWDYEIEPLDFGIFAPYGLGVGGANVLDLDSVSDPNLGTTVQLDIAGASPGRRGWLLQRSSQVSQPFKGGTLLVPRLGPWSYPGFRYDAGGEASVEITIPNVSRMLGRTLYFQAFSREPGLPERTGLSNGLRMVIGQG